MLQILLLLFLQPLLLPGDATQSRLNPPKAPSTPQLSQLVRPFQGPDPLSGTTVSGVMLFNALTFNYWDPDRGGGCRRQAMAPQECQPLTTSQ